MQSITCELQDLNAQYIQHAKDIDNSRLAMKQIAKAIKQLTSSYHSSLTRASKKQLEGLIACSVCNKSVHRKFLKVREQRTSAGVRKHKVFVDLLGRRWNGRSCPDCRSHDKVLE